MPRARIDVSNLHVGRQPPAASRQPIMSLSWSSARRELTRRLSEPAPGTLQLVTGPRQSGKSSLLREIAGPFGDLLVETSGDGSSPVAGISALPGAWRAAERIAAERGRALLVVDDVHLAKGWEAWIGGAWGCTRAAGLPLHVVLAGTCALDRRLATSTCTWLELVPLGRWTASSLVEAGPLDARRATDRIVSVGAWPPSADLPASQVGEHAERTLVTPALTRDLPAVCTVRKPALLRPIFDACVAAATRTVSLSALRAACRTDASLDTVATYVALLGDLGLVAAIPELGRGRWSPRDAVVRIVILDNALLAVPPVSRDAGASASRVAATEPDSTQTLRVRNACLAHARRSGSTMRFWREGALEVDAVVDGGGLRQLLLVRLGTVSERELEGLEALCSRLPSYQPVLVGDEHVRHAAAAADIDWIHWRDFLNCGL